MRTGDCRDGELPIQLDVKDDAAVCILLDEAPDLAGIVAGEKNPVGRERRGEW